VSYMLLVYLHVDCKRYKSDFNKIVSRFRRCSKRRKVLQQQQQILLDISSVCSFYTKHGVVKDSSEDAWYNCFLCYFTNLTKLHSLHVSNFYFLTVICFCSRLFHNIYVFNLTSYIKHEKNIYDWNWYIIFLNKKNKNAKRTDRYTNEVKFTITVCRDFVIYIYIY